MASSTATQQINEVLSIKDWRKLCDLLNSNKKWRQLGLAMDYTDSELDRISTARGMCFTCRAAEYAICCERSKSFFSLYICICFVISDTPAEALIADCCKRQRNHKISDVYKQLIKIQCVDGVNLLKKHVEESDDNEMEME